jgi:hypothetical protein
MENTSTYTGQHINTQHSSKNLPNTMENTSTYMGQHANTQHSRINDPSLWETQAHIRDNMQTHNTAGETTHHYGIHKHIYGTTYKHTTQQEGRPSLWDTQAYIRDNIQTYNTAGETTHHYEIH